MRNRYIKLMLIACCFCSWSAIANDISGIAIPATSAECNNGSIELIVTGGFSPYTYEWNGPNGYYSNDEDISDLEVGTYTVIVYDGLCGEATMSFEIECLNCGSEIVLDKIVDESCAGLGSIDIHVSGVSSNSIKYFWFVWDENSLMWRQINSFTTGPSGGDLTGIKAGKYKLEVVFGSCKLSKVLTVGIFSADVKADIEIIRQVSECKPGIKFGGAYSSSNDGIACVNLPNLHNYTLNWSNGHVGNCQYNLAPGTYSVTAVSENGCEVNLGEVKLCCCSNPTELPSHPSIPFCHSTTTGNATGNYVLKKISINSATNSNSNDGMISIIVEPSVIGAIYSWSDPNIPNSGTVKNLNPGTYCVTVTLPCVEEKLIGCYTIINCAENPVLISGDKIRLYEKLYG